MKSSRARHHLRTVPRRLATAGALLMLAAACGSDDGASVRDLGDAESGSSSASGTGSSSASAPADVPSECAPVHEDLEAEATQVVEMTLADFAFDQERYEVEAGVVTFAVTNDGSVNHEVAFLPGGGDVPYTDEGTPDEEALEAAGAFELEAFGSGRTCNATYDLAPGTYTLFCIVPIGEGRNHYDEGMRATLVVT